MADAKTTSGPETGAVYKYVGSSALGKPSGAGSDWLTKVNYSDPSLWQQTNLTPDPRLQLILIAFAFGGFIEGLAGFGAPVAITGAILIQLGFRPLQASCLALIANTAPVAFGSLGIPITTLSQVTGLDVMA